MPFLVLMVRYRILGERYGYLSDEMRSFPKFFSSAQSKPSKIKAEKGEIVLTNPNFSP
jgi:hypothetical protein